MASNARILEIILRAKDETAKGIQAASKSIGSISKIGAGVTAFGTGMAAGLDQAANSAISYGKEVIMVKRLTGETSENASKFTAVLARNGVTGKATAAVVKNLANQIAFSDDKYKKQTKTVIDAQGHHKKVTTLIMTQQSALHQMGVATEDANGKNRSTIDVMADVAEYYSKAEDKTKAVALVSKVLGKNYAALLPVLNGGKEGIAKMTAEAEKNGKILGDQSVDQISKYNAAMKKNTEATEGLKIQAGLAFLPIKTLIVEVIGKGISFFTNLSPAMKSTIMGFTIFATVASLVIGPLLMFIGFLPAIVSGVGLVSAGFSAEAIAAAAAWVATLGPVALVIAAIALVAGGIYLVVRNWDTIGPFFKKMWAGVVKFFTGFWDTVKEFVGTWGVEILAVLVPFIGVPLLIKKHWDKIGPMLTRVWDGVKLSVKKGIDNTIAYVKQLPQRMVDALKNLASMIAQPVKAALKVLGDLNPFMRHSPSLVDNVLAGTAAIQNAYAGVSGMRIAAPKLAAFSVPAVAYAGGSSGYTAGYAGRSAASGEGFRGTIEIPLKLNGREVGRAMAQVSNTNHRTGSH